MVFTHRIPDVLGDYDALLQVCLHLLWLIPMDACKMPLSVLDNVNVPRCASVRGEKGGGREIETERR